jgi:hypothetical protein
MQAADDQKIVVKVPEGFAFYALFPEQYCAAASAWVSARGAGLSGAVLVVGIRSIGTALSAVVAATLRARGFRAERLTVRPTGPPFTRRVEAPAPELNGLRHALIVDEGPGLSGSSMVAVAEWLTSAGVSDIAFLPGHEEEPGGSASGSCVSPRVKVPQVWRQNRWSSEIKR